MKFLKKKVLRAFTLIELLIVIAIIGILASIILVNLSEARREANRAAFVAETSSLKAKFMLACRKGVLNIAGSELPPYNSNNDLEFYPSGSTNFNLRYLNPRMPDVRVVNATNTGNNATVCSPAGSQNFAVWVRNRKSFGTRFGIAACNVWITPNAVYVDRELSGGSSGTVGTPVYNPATDTQVLDDARCMAN